MSRLDHAHTWAVFLFEIIVTIYATNANEKRNFEAGKKGERGA
jgi:hypothetical protein